MARLVYRWLLDALAMKFALAACCVLVAAVGLALYGAARWRREDESKTTWDRIADLYDDEIKPPKVRWAKPDERWQS